MNVNFRYMMLAQSFNTKWNLIGYVDISHLKNECISAKSYFFILLAGYVIFFIKWKKKSCMRLKLLHNNTNTLFIFHSIHPIPKKISRGCDSNLQILPEAKNMGYCMHQWTYLTLLLGYDVMFDFHVYVEDTTRVSCPKL